MALELPFLPIPKDNILESSEGVVVEIYRITCKTTGKLYIGQTVSHVLNHKKWRRYGSHKRFLSHVSEAIKNNKPKQCPYLNNAIRKYGQQDFFVEVIGVCEKKEADMWEKATIKNYDSLFPNGYNVKLGGQNFEHTEESREKVSVGVETMYKTKRDERFLNIHILPHFDPEDFLYALRRDGKVYGWKLMMVTSEREVIKTDFGGSRRPEKEAREMAIQFIRQLQEKEGDVKTRVYAVPRRTKMDNPQPSTRNSIREG